jgi:tRNA A37 methylthiotransferase MiaB
MRLDSYNFNDIQKVSVLTNGCPENRIDSARVLDFFIKNGLKSANNFKDADLILFNACALTHYNEVRSLSIIDQLKAHKKPNAGLIVFGCLAKINKDRLREVYPGPTFGSDDIDKLDQIFNYKIKTKNVDSNYLIPLTTLNKYKWFLLSCKENGVSVTLKKLITAGFWAKKVKAVHCYNPRTFCIKISTGCLSNCSYCGVKLSRGPIKSKSIENVYSEFDKGLRDGFNEFALIGTDIGAYGRDRGSNLAHLLTKLLEKDGDYKIKLRNVNPKFLISMLPEFREIFKTGKIPYLISAAQSGSNKILKLMKRGYNIQDFKRAILLLKTEFPNIQIRTQIMVGFPGETEDDFHDSMQLLDEVKFDFVEVYIYQPRPGTVASKMENQVPEKVARRRWQKLFNKAIFCDYTRNGNLSYDKINNPHT